MTFPPDRLGQCARAPAIASDGSGASTTLSVLTYNVEGLPWPARRSRKERLEQIARELAAMRAAGSAPDVVLLQEAFTGTAAHIGEHAGYANYVRGPSARMRRPEASAGADPRLIESRKWRRGEASPPLLSSGLYILSDYPIVFFRRQPFRAAECAGYDCLANKGLLHARIVVPGVPEPVELFNTHLNARVQSRVSQRRTHMAHRLQLAESLRFIENSREPSYPMIFGGDFNMRRSPPRFEMFDLLKPWPIVHQWCTRPEANCDVRMSWDGDEPWMDTQDLQGFDNGEQVKVEPIRVEAMFDRPWRGRPLADHDGFLTVYRLSWPARLLATTSPAALACARGGHPAG